MDKSSITEREKGIIILILLSGIYAIFGLFSRYLNLSLLSNREITVLTFFFATTMVFIYSIFIGEGLPQIQWTVSIIAVIIIAGFFNVLSILFANYGFQHVKGILASNLLTLEAFFGILYGFLFYRELPNLKELLGGILIIISVIQMNRLEYKTT